MEEAVTRKFVHEDSSHIISFCGESVAVALKSSFFLCGLSWRYGVFEQRFSVILLLCNCRVIFRFPRDSIREFGNRERFREEFKDDIHALRRDNP